MRVLRDEAAIAALPEAGLRALIQKRVSEISEHCPWDADELGYFVVVEPGDPLDTLEAEIGFSVLRNLFNDTPFGHPDFAPAFELAEAHPEGYFELVYILGDGGFGYDLFIVDQPGVDPALLRFCRTYALPA
ncbi:hypothetical protein [Hydrogenophaga sp.]|uniref:hypothetical protein n=1 Tax=Hydrogenophaga sp. TaxID=1904254 RepID=UPI0035AE32A7